MPPLELLEQGAHTMTVCNACRYCEQYCPVFPAMEERLTFGKADRARTSVNFREILDAMWLFNEKFERALAKFNEIKAQKRG